MNSTTSGRILLGALAAICILLVPVSAETAPLWTLSMQEDIKWFNLTETGNLVVATKSTLCGIDSDDGSEVWRMPNTEKLKEGDLELIPFTPYGLVSLRKNKRGPNPMLIMVNVVDGQEIWNTEELGLGESYGHFFLHHMNALLIYGKMATEPKDKVVMALDIETGVPLWDHRDFFGDKDPPLYRFGDPEKGKKLVFGHQFPQFDTDSTMILFITKTGLRKYNLWTGELLWEAPVKTGAPPALQEGYAPMLLSEDYGVVYTPYKKRIGAFNTKDGSRLWSEDPKFKGIVHQLELTPNGLIVRRGPNAEDKGKHEISMLDPATGQSLWDMPFKKIKDGSNFILNEGRIVMAGNKKLYSIDPTTGKYTILAEDVKFDGDEKPQTLELRDGGYLLSSSQNTMLIKFEGSLAYHSYQKAPGTSFLSVVGKALVAEIINSTLSYSTTSGDFTFSAWVQMEYPDLYERFKASSESNRCVYQLTNIETVAEKGPGLVKLSKDQGKVEKSIVLGSKTPVYEIDTFTSKLFFQSDRKKITCYDF